MIAWLALGTKQRPRSSIYLLCIPPLEEVRELLCTVEAMKKKARHLHRLCRPSSVLYTCVVGLSPCVLCDHASKKHGHGRFKRGSAVHMSASLDPSSGAFSQVLVTIVGQQHEQRVTSFQVKSLRPRHHSQCDASHSRSGPTGCGLRPACTAPVQLEVVAPVACEPTQQIQTTFFRLSETLPSTQFSLFPNNVGFDSMIIATTLCCT